MKERKNIFMQNSRFTGPFITPHFNLKLTKEFVKVELRICFNLTTAQQIVQVYFV